MRVIPLLASLLIVCLAATFGNAQDGEKAWDILESELLQLEEQSDYEGIAKFDAELVDGLDPRQIASEAAHILLRLANHRLSIGYGDPLHLLQLARQSRTPTVEIDFDEQLSYAMMLAGLPWGAIDLLGPREAELTDKGRALLNQAQGVLTIIRDDARAVHPFVDLYEKRTNLEARLIDLLGIPPIESVRFYHKLDLESATRYSADPECEGALAEDPACAPESDVDATQDEDTRLALFGRLPLLQLLFAGNDARGVREVYNLPRTEEIKPLSLTPRQLKVSKRLMDTIRESTSEPVAAVINSGLLNSLDIATMLSDVDPEMANFIAYDPEEASGTLELATTFNSGALLFFRLGFVSSAAFVLLPTSDGSVDLFLFPAIDALSVAPLNIDGQPGNELVLQTFAGSGGYMNLAIFSPRHRQITTLADGSNFDHGSASFLNLDTDQALEIVVSHANGDRRFEKCNQCPSRRIAILFDYHVATDTYVPVGARQSGTDLFVQMNQNIGGVSPDMFMTTNRAEVTEAFKRIGRGNTEYFTETFLKDAGLIIGKYAGLLRETRRYADSIALLDRFLALSIGAKSTDIGSIIRAVAKIDQLQSLFLLGDFDRVEEAAQDPELVESMKQRERVRGDVENILMLSRLQGGDFDGAYRSLEAGASLASAEMTEEDGALEGNRALYLAAVGDYESSSAAALRALDLAVASSDYNGAAIDMILAASAAMATGRNAEAVDWISRAIRIGNSSRFADKTAMALIIGANIALQTNHADIALHLLDQVLAISIEEIWQSHGPIVLRLYAQAFMETKQLDAALAMFAAAIERASDQRGSEYVAALFEKSKLSLAMSDIDHAMDLSNRAFAAVLDGRARIGIEGHKLTFIGTAAEVAEHHLQLLRDTGASVETILGAMEAWRLQVFRDVYRDRFSAANSDGPTSMAARSQAFLHEDEAIVSYSIGQVESFAVVVGRQEAPRLVPLDIGSEDLRKLVARATRWLNAENPESLTYMKLGRLPGELVEVLRKLHSYLIGPLNLGRNIRTVVLSPDENLIAVPWAALLEPDQGILDSFLEFIGRPSHRALVEQLSIVIVPSLEVFFNREQSTSSETEGDLSALLVGGFSGVSETVLRETAPFIGHVSHAVHVLPSLEHGAEELRAVNNALGANFQRSILIDKKSMERDLAFPTSRQATRDAVLTAFENKHLIHVTAHGLFNPLAPMESVLFLDPSDEPQVLRASDLLKLDLSAANVVSLAACNTARSAIAPGAETFGFLRGLMGAGSKTVILTQWAVDDAATTAWFETFYKALADESVAEAAKRATLAVRDRWPHPFFWAAPTIYGDWRTGMMDW